MTEGNPLHANRHPWRWVMDAEADGTRWCLGLHCGHTVERKRTTSRANTEPLAPRKVRCEQCGESDEPLAPDPGAVPLLPACAVCQVGVGVPCRSASGRVVDPHLGRDR